MTPVHDDSGRVVKIIGVQVGAQRAGSARAASRRAAGGQQAGGGRSAGGQQGAVGLRDCRSVVRLRRGPLARVARCSSPRPPRTGRPCRHHWSGDARCRSPALTSTPPAIPPSTQLDVTNTTEGLEDAAHGVPLLVRYDYRMQVGFSHFLSHASFVTKSGLFRLPHAGGCGSPPHTPASLKTPTSGGSCLRLAVPPAPLPPSPPLLLLQRCHRCSRCCSPCDRLPPPLSRLCNDRSVAVVAPGLRPHPTYDPLCLLSPPRCRKTWPSRRWTTCCWGCRRRRGPPAAAPWPSATARAPSARRW